MTDGSTRGFLFSATLHGVVAALMFFSFVLKSDEHEVPPIFELVAGEGDNYMAREAPALGTPGGVTIDIPDTPRAAPPPPKVAPPAPSKQPETPVLDFKQKLRRDVILAESRAKLEIKRQREAEARQRAADAKRQREAEKRAADAQDAADLQRAADANRMTKEEFDRANKGKRSPSPRKSTAPVKVAKIDAAGIAKGVAGGSTNNKVGGAGGTALKTDNLDVLAAYDAMFKQRLRAEFEPPPGLSDSLKAEIEVRSNADGSLSSPRVSKSSGSPEFDRAVLNALQRVRMPPRPDRKSEVIAFFFTMRERLGG